MERASERVAKAVRRGGVKLLSLGGGHGELNMVISEQKDVKNTAKAFMAAQNSAAQYLLKWANNEDNRAIQDVSHQIVELNQLWTEAQREFAEQLKEFKHMFDLVLEGEKQVDHAKNNLVACEQREAKIKKEIKKVAKKATTEELMILENRLLQAESQKDLSVIEVEDKIRENEAVKVLRFKAGYMKLSSSYVELGRKCAIIFEAQRNISSQIPDALNHDLEDMKYTGSGATKQYVLRAKERVRKYKRQQQMQNSLGTPVLDKVEDDVDDDEPPPPYTPGDFYDHPYPSITTNIQHGTTTSWEDPIPRPRPQPHHQPQQQQHAEQHYNPPQHQHTEQHVETHYQQQHQLPRYQHHQRPSQTERLQPVPPDGSREQPTEFVINDLNWGNVTDEEEASLSGAMGGIGL